MSDQVGLRARWVRFVNRLRARHSARVKPATAFVSAPEPRSIGSVLRGRQLVAGNLLFSGHLVEAPGAMIWDLDAPDLAYLSDIHGFEWLDDLAALPDERAQELAQSWTYGWMDRYGGGTGPGWDPALTGRRLIRWIHHATLLLRAQEAAQSERFFHGLAHHVLYLARSWHTAPPGIARFEALCGLVYAGLSLKGMEPHTPRALAALEEECARHIAPDGGLLTRNPEELMEVLTLLTWVTEALTASGRPYGPNLTKAIQRIVPVLRTLRHSDGTLARFHGGGRGAEGRLDTALATSGVKSAQTDGLAMGFARLHRGRTSLIIDAAPPPQDEASINAHASTLAFEMTSGRRALIVNCGSGAIFGDDWRRAGRATPSHSTLALEGYSSARLAKSKRLYHKEILEDAPTTVPIKVDRTADALRFEGTHDGYVTTHGLTHARRLELSLDGSVLIGEDRLLARSAEDQKRFERRLDEVTLQGLTYVIRFHLHPDVAAELDLGGTAVSLLTRSGETWVFRHDGFSKLTLEASVYLEKGRLRPRATRQIVLTGRAMQYATPTRWSLAKTQETPVAVRDLVRDEPT